MAIHENGPEVTDMELQVARRWAKVFRALLDEGNPDAQAIVNAMHQWAAPSTSTYSLPYTNTYSTGGAS